MSTPIPEWARKAAQEAYDRYANGEGGDVRDCIASALMAEREACAQIAEECGASAVRFMTERLESHSIDIQRFAEGCISVASAVRDRSKT